MIYLNGTQIIPTIFPDYTRQVWKINPKIVKKNNNEITWEFEIEDEFIQVAQLKFLVDYMAEPSYFPVSSTILNLPYLPYGRQDKEVSNDSTFALYPFMKVMNSLNFAKIKVLDPHPNFLPDYLNDVEILSPKEYIDHAFEASESHMIAFPDDGARRRYEKLFPNTVTLSAKKVRDPATGEIQSLEIDTSYVNPRYLRVLIVDDICDGGATFISLASVLRACGAANISLYVTHGIFSKGFYSLHKAGIEKIYTHKGLVSSK